MKLIAAHSTASLINNVHQADIFDLCERVYRAGVLVDMILADLPYQVTAMKWDKLIPFDPMWTWFKRIVKANGAIVLTASQPFTSALIMSNPRIFRYCLVWDKKFAGNFNLSTVQPMQIHEDICVFGQQQVNYYPMMIKRGEVIKGGGMSKSESANTSGFVALNKTYTEKYPISILHFPREIGRTIHPTQKPVALFDYLIRTYTQIGDIVFDPTAGSGTTAVAARGCNRRYIVGDREQKYVEVMRDRLAKPYQLDLFAHTAQRETA